MVMTVMQLMQGYGSHMVCFEVLMLLL